MAALSFQYAKVISTKEIIKSGHNNRVNSDAANTVVRVALEALSSIPIGNSR